MDLLSALNVFTRAAERESFAVAARDLGLSQATVTRTVQALERHYGVELLRRSTRKMTLTEAGRSLLAGGVDLLDAAQALTVQVAGGDGVPLAGRLRVTAASGFSTLVLAPLAARFAREHPDVGIEVLCTDRFLDLVEENIDLAFRVGLLDDSSLRQRVVARLPEVLVAAPTYLATCPVLTCPGDVAHHPFIGLSILRGSAQALRLSSPASEIVVRPENQLLFDTPLAVRECLVAGGGIGRIHLYMVAADLDAGRLCYVLQRWACPTWTMSVLKTARTSTRLAEAFLAQCEAAIASTRGLEPP